ncbi:MAG: iron-containing alcohol dehydrogenase [Rhodospirillales bacterium]|jgi:glycerol dehydrogenase|nr:iron-containing alcohol dehydrogenase [Rhodospirillales bacterium]
MTNQFKILGAPGRYIQGQGAISLLPEIASELSPPALILADEIVLQIIQDDLRAGFKSANIPCNFSQFAGECTRAEIEKQANDARALNCGVVIAIGGGKAIDTAKGVSLALGIPIIIAPSIASNDAPTSRLIVVYDDEHRITEVLKLPRNPDFVVVDTELISQAPPRFLIAGIGDAIAKKF